MGWILFEKLAQKAWCGAQIKLVEHADSSQKVLKSWLNEQPGLPSGSTVLCRAQSAGTGRHDRGWLTAPGAVAMSTLIWSQLPTHQIHWYTAAAGIALAETLQQFGICAQLKWPNDVLLGTKKIAGIITHLHDIPLELIPAAGSNCIVLGIGLNLRGQRCWFTKNKLPSAGSVTSETPIRQLQATEVAANILTWLNSLSGQLESKGPMSLINSYKHWISDAGHTAIVRTASGNQLQGTVQGIGSDGELLIADANGIHAVSAGTVEWL